MKGLIRLGDDTSHGGKVISASSTYVVDGLRVAVLGDLISCPRRGHSPVAIVEASSDFFCDGRALVVDGCRAACGCVLLASCHMGVF